MHPPFSQLLQFSRLWCCYPGRPTTVRIPSAGKLRVISRYTAVTATKGQLHRYVNHCPIGCRGPRRLGTATLLPRRGTRIGWSGNSTGTAGPVGVTFGCRCRHVSRRLTGSCGIQWRRRPSLQVGRLDGALTRRSRRRSTCSRIRRSDGSRNVFQLAAPYQTRLVRERIGVLSSGFGTAAAAFLGPGSRPGLWLPGKC